MCVFVYVSMCVYVFVCMCVCVSVRQAPFLRPAACNSGKHPCKRSGAYLSLALAVDNVGEPRTILAPWAVPLDNEESWEKKEQGRPESD